MSKSIDERVVSMAFENQVFEQRAAKTLATLAKLDSSISKAGAVNGLSQIEAAANKVTLQQPMSAMEKLRARFSRSGADAAQGMSQIENAGNRVQLLSPLRALDFLRNKVGQIGQNAPPAFNEIERASDKVQLRGLNSALDSVSAKFSIVQGAAAVAFGNITSQASMRGAAAIKNFSIGPVTDGLNEYKTNLQSIQTILANTQGQKVSGLDNVNKALSELNHYSDQTIYNFSEMAKNIGTFTAAGVDLPKATASIKGIANLAALSGSNSQQASTAMYQLSQAISAGRVGLQDWNSVVNAGMGGAVFQKSLMRTAENMGALKDGAVKIDKATGKATVNGESFRNSIMAKPGQESWLTSEVLTNTLQQLTGDLSDAELKAKGFTDEQIKAIQAQAKTAKAAATEVKTLDQVFDVARETIGSGWSQTFQMIFGDFKESKKTFTELSNTINGFINKVSDARNKLLKGWKELGGRKVLIDGLKAGFGALFDILKPIGQAFRDIFPKQTAQGLFDMTRNFRDLMKSLKPSAEVIDGLRRTFRGLFALLHIGWAVVKGIIGVFGDLAGVLGDGSGGFLDFTGSIGDFLVSLDAALTKGGLLMGFFDNVSAVLKIPLQLLMGVSDAIAGLFGGTDKADASGLADGLSGVTSAAGPMASALNTLKVAWDKLVDIFSDAKELVSPWMEKIGEQLSNFGSLLADAFETADVDKVMSVLQTGFIGGIFLSIKKGIEGFGGVKDMFGGVNDAFGALTGQLTAMQNNLKARTLQAIAIAIGILAASVWAISKIDAEDLTKSMTAIAVGFGQLVAAMAILGAVMKGQGKLALLSMPVISVSMVALATSLVILSGAMKIFSTMSWDELVRGLVGVGGALAAIGVGMKVLGPGTIIQGPAILVLAIGINALALAVKQFASMSWEDLARGLLGVVGALVALISPVSILGPSLLITGPGLIAAAFGMNMLAGALTRFSEIDPMKMAIGIGGMIAALATIGVAIGFMPPLLIAQAGALILMGIALSGIAGAVSVMGNIPLQNLIVGLTGMAGALAILAIGLNAMSTAGPGSLALLAAAGAFAVLGPALAFIGSLSIVTIVKGLVAMAAVMGVLALAGTYAAPGITALGFALLPLAGVFALTAASAFIFAKALQMLGGEGKKGIGVMVAALAAFALVLPKLVIDLVQGFVETIGMVAKLAPKVAAAIVTIVGQLIQAVIRLMPQWTLAMGAFITSFVTILGQNAPKIIAAGWKLLMDFLSGITQNLPKLIVTAGTIITQFLAGLATQVPSIVAAGGRLIVAYLTGIAGQVGNLVTAAVNLIGQFVLAVASQAGRLVTIGAQAMLGFIGSVSSKAGDLLAAGVGVILNFLTGIGQAIPRIARRGLDVARRFIQAIANGLVQFADIAATGLIDFMNGLAEVIRDRAPEIRHAAGNLGRAIIGGIVDGIKELANKPLEELEKLAKKLPGPVRKILGIHSPSRVFHELGQFAMLGLANGLNDSTPEKTMVAQGKRLVDTAKETLNAIPSALDGVMDADPVISPVLDLSAVEKEAKRLGGMTEVSPLKPLTSLEHAAAIADVASAAPTPSDTVPQVIKETKFEQTITSPEAISDVDIYRHTKNLLSAATESNVPVP